MEFNLFIGIDVSKKTLDYAIVEEGEQKLTFKTENSSKGIEEFFNQLKKYYEFDVRKGVFCMEYTGIYNNHLLDYLTVIKANIWLENPIHIKKSLGLVRGKNDKVDAQRIAMFAYKNEKQTKLWVPQRKVIQTLKALTGVRARIMKAMETLKKPLDEIKSFVDKDTRKNIKQACKSSLNALKRDLKDINDQIVQMMMSDGQLSKLYKIVTSVQNVGPVIATAVIIETNEFKKFSNAKQFACYAGVAPFRYTSGTSIKSKAKVSHMANKHLKTLFHLSALGAVSRPGELKDYFDRKVAEGKNKMLVINAVRNKIILRIFACVKQNKSFAKC